jgi:uncharacterized protein
MEMPVPEPSLETQPFWDAAREERLVIPYCKACGFHWFPPALACERCGEADYSWVDASGRGKVFTFAIYHRLYHPAFKGKLPYVVAVVELEEGPRLISNIVGVPHERIRCEMPVRVVFDHRRDGIKVPQFTLCES